MFTVPVIIEAIVKIPKYDKHIIAARGAEPREFLPARYPHDAEEAAKANIAKGSIPDAGSGIFKPQSQLRRKKKAIQQIPS